ncbi:hypothetical protein PGTUg99_033722 [Puccinia graminis f. sp. tritici]|uniref:Uncharacterized protein n=1 Tax=Puccinia graminis f. sp. tritici TaxID=56615 RepID=A0A5B0S1H9_PUCGR|nr:hypothetical protein PGTUg99_033722 [Puccinia graminis f. sp. tritici]
MALLNPVRYVPPKSTRSRTESYFNLNTESLDSRGPSELRPAVAPTGTDQIEPVKLERLRPTILKNQGKSPSQIDAMKADNKHIISLIKDLKKRDDFLGGKVEDFYKHLKILGQARLYDLCIDSPLTLGTRHSTIQAPSPSLTEASPCEVARTPSAPNLIVSLVKCLGVILPFNKNEPHFSKSSDEIITESSQTLQPLGSRNTHQGGSPKMETASKESELHGEPLRMIQSMVFPLDELWMGLESLMPVGLPKCFGEWKTSDRPLIREWYYAVTWLDYYSSQERSATYSHLASTHKLKFLNQKLLCQRSYFTLPNH